MTDNTSDIRPAAPPDASGGASPAPSVPPSRPEVSSKPPRARSVSSTLIAALVIVALLAIALGGALWAQRREFRAAGQEVASRLDQMNRELSQARQEGRQALALAQAQTNQVADLEGRIREVQTQNSALQQAWQTFSSGASDEILVNDVDRMITLASQQLRLAGDVNNAIVALETAQSRLAQADRPRLAGLQQSINGDLDRLRAVTTVDIPAQSARIERLVALVGRAPLLVPDDAAPLARPGQSRPEAAQPAPPPVDPTADLPADAPWWQRWRAEVESWPGRAGQAVAHELGDLIRVQRVDEPSALLLSPEQATMVRSTLRQRLLTVQLAMLMRQQPVWKTELDNVQDTLARYFDERSQDTMAARTLARELSQVEIAVRVPDVSDSLSTIAALRAAGSKAEGQD
ncbi:uroporphyrinogen-III C-methyltransferase [Bordetella genomosp. 13]|uniref:Heme biosynthesis operon protein HemX n=1 Tax=Bordetella genomosp. 13 TaxID=463040 RepID=A0A1W6ZBN6_9BORD|nr:uroporphyrinogen-III C-methyltransferase [Bordetella genomosp. 13]ARP94672.1 heme biosynthesis operon protein HemX [Bordetella genomosp. 13]